MNNVTINEVKEWKESAKSQIEDLLRILISEADDLNVNPYIEASASWVELPMPDLEVSLSEPEVFVKVELNI